MSVKIEISEKEHEIPLTIRNKQHPFSTGSLGYHAGGRIYVPSVKDGELKEHVVSCTIVEVGSKPEKTK